MYKAFRYRLEPTAEQEQKLRQFAGARRFIWNWALQQRREYYQQTGKSLPHKELSAHLTALKDEPDTAWLKEIDSQLLQQVLIDLQSAFTNFSERRAHYPRFKSKKRDRARFRIPQRVKAAGSGVQLPKIGRVRLRLSQPVVGETKSATFKQDARGYWHVTLVADIDVPEVARPMPEVERSIGVDMGLKDIVVYSDIYREPAPRFYRRGERTLRRAQRVHSRRKKGSRNQAKARDKLARVHQHVANQRTDFLHKLTTKLIKKQQAVCTEDLGVKSLARTKLAKSVHDAGMGTLRWQLAYKGQWYGTHVVAVDRFYPYQCRWLCPRSEPRHTTGDCGVQAPSLNQESQVLLPWECQNEW